MSTFGYFVLGIIVAIYLVRAIDKLAGKLWKHALRPAWEIFKPRPGGKLWMATRFIKGN